MTVKSSWRRPRIPIPIVVAFIGLAGTLGAVLITYLLYNPRPNIDMPSENCTQSYTGWSGSACGVLTSMHPKAMSWGVKVDPRCLVKEPEPRGGSLLLHRPLQAVKLGELIYQPHQVEIWFDPVRGLTEVDLKSSIVNWQDLCDTVQIVLGKEPDARSDKMCQWIKKYGKNMPFTEEKVWVAKGQYAKSVVRAKVLWREPADPYDPESTSPLSVSGGDSSTVEIEASIPKVEILLNNSLVWGEPAEKHVSYLDYTSRMKHKSNEHLIGYHPMMNVSIGDLIFLHDKTTFWYHDDKGLIEFDAFSPTYSVDTICKAITSVLAQKPSYSTVTACRWVYRPPGQKLERMKLSVAEPETRDGETLVRARIDLQAEIGDE